MADLASEATQAAHNVVKIAHKHERDAMETWSEALKTEEPAVIDMAKLLVDQARENVTDA